MAARDVLKNVNLFVDGKGQAGQLQEFNPPKLTLKMDEARLGGMDGSIELEMGMEKLESAFTLIGYDADVLALMGVRPGASIPLVARGVLESFDGSTTAVAHTMRGKLKEVDPGTWKPGEAAPLKGMVALTYYKLQHGDRIVHEIDVENMVRVVDGVDVLAAQRSALGI
jgi:P2 family phage contractile tail tube protein